MPGARATVVQRGDGVATVAYRPTMPSLNIICMLY